MDFQWLFFIPNNIKKLQNKIEKCNYLLVSIIAFTLYTLLHFVISYYHEPWYDEAAAWQIARGASIKDIIFYLPHYEGHPPLWHLILVPFAKSGMPYELSLSIISYFFIGCAIALLLWKAPFPKVVNVLLPFTYYFFYQFSVISRPYCIMMLAFVCMAITYKRKNEKPFLYVLSLMLLCLSSAYGILYAGGIALVWVGEIIKKETLIGWLKKCYKEKRTYALCALLLLACLLGAILAPRSDTCAVNDNKTISSILLSFLYLSVGIYSDITCTDFYSVNKFLQNFMDEMKSYDYIMFLTIFIIGGFILFSILRFGKKNKTLLLFICPQFMVSVFASFVYFGLHHTGVILLFGLFWLWVTTEKSKEFTSCPLSTQKSELFITAINRCFWTICILISIGWSVLSSVNEIRYVYSIGRKEAEFIKDNGLDQYRIMSSFDMYQEKGEIKRINTNLFYYTDNVLPYFDHNIFAYIGFESNREMPYVVHATTDEEIIQQRFSEWRAIGEPDILFLSSLAVRNSTISLVFEDEESWMNYRPIYEATAFQIWKGTYTELRITICMRFDLMKKLGFTAIY